MSIEKGSQNGEEKQKIKDVEVMVFSAHAKDGKFVISSQDKFKFELWKIEFKQN